jgi:hypothetical membrane protein
MVVSRADEKNQTLIRLSGLCGIIGSVLTIILVFAATALSPWFRWDTNALSELGVGEVSLLFNSAVMIGGVLSLLFAFGIHEYMIKGRSVKAGTALMMLSSISLFLVGIFTIENLILHATVSLGYFVLTPIGFMLIGFGAKKNKLKKLSIAVGIAALTSILVLPVMLLNMSFKVGFAVPEMTEALILAIWMIFTGVKLLKYEH